MSGASDDTFVAEIHRDGEGSLGLAMPPGAGRKKIVMFVKDGGAAAEWNKTASTPIEQGCELVTIDGYEVAPLADWRQAVVEEKTPTTLLVRRPPKADAPPPAASHAAPMLATNRACVEEEYPNILALFKRFDSDGNGTISREEMRTIWQYLDSPLTSEQLDRMFKAADKNNDGKINYSEFLAWLMDDRMDQRLEAALQTLAIHRYRSKDVADMIDVTDTWPRERKDGWAQLTDTWSSNRFAKTKRCPLVIEFQEGDDDGGHQIEIEGGKAITVWLRLGEKKSITWLGDESCTTSFNKRCTWAEVTFSYQRAGHDSTTHSIASKPFQSLHSHGIRVHAVGYDPLGNAPHMKKYYELLEKARYRNIGVEIDADTIAQMRTCVEKSFKHHDIDNSGCLSNAESSLFFAHIMAAEARLVEAISGVLPRDVNGGSKTQDRQQMAMQDYRDNKERLDAAAFAVLDSHGDGQLRLEDVLPALTPGEPKYHLFKAALGVVFENAACVD